MSPGRTRCELAVPTELCRASKLKGLHWQPDTKDRFESKGLSAVLANLKRVGQETLKHINETTRWLTDDADGDRQAMVSSPKRTYAPSRRRGSR